MNKNKTTIKTSILGNQKGVALYMSLLILTSIFLIAMGVSDLVFTGIKMGRVQTHSTQAYFAAEAGAEKIIWKYRQDELTTSEENEANIFSKTLGNGSSYQINYYFSSDNAWDYKKFISIGSYQNVRRSVEVMIKYPRDFETTGGGGDEEGSGGEPGETPPTDLCGNNYNTVTIGNQIWLAENINCDIHNAGNSWCYANDPANCDIYGRLYDWDATMNGETFEGARGICPVGWHIPTDAEWYELENYLATGDCDPDRIDWSCDPAGDRLKPGGDSGFNALFGGRRDSTSFFFGGSTGYFWSSTPTESSDYFIRFVNSANSSVYRISNYSFGLSVRCLKD